MKQIPHFFRTAVIVSAGFFVFALISGTRPAGAEEKTKAIIAMGESPVKSNLGGAREAAVGDCLKSAVEIAAIGELPIPLLTEKFDAVGNLLAERKDEFIQDYKVLQESKTEGIYRVLVQATISLEKLRQAMAAAGVTASIEKMPQVLLLVSEQRPGESSVRYWWQKDRPVSDEASVSAIKEALQSKGIPVINPQLVPADFLYELQIPADLSDNDAMELGRRFFADAVVVGTAIAEETSNRMGENIRPVRGVLNVHVIFIQTGEKGELIESSATAADKDPAAGIQASLSDAGKQAGEKLAVQMIAAWEKQLQPGGEVILSIKGKNILANLNEFRNALKNTAGISNQRTLEIASDKAVLSVTYQGKSQELADAILVQSFRGFGVNIYEVAARSLNIEMTPK